MRTATKLIPALAIERLACAAILFALAATPACANEFMFSQATAGPILWMLILWLLVGLVLFFCRLKPKFLGVGSLLAIGLCFFLDGHLEVVIMIWMIYVALAAIYCMRPREGLNDKTRRVNLIYHGTFLLLMIVAGATAKYFYWSKAGGFVAWSLQMKEMYPAFLYGFGFLALIVAAWTEARENFGRKVKE